MSVTISVSAVTKSSSASAKGVGPRVDSASRGARITGFPITRLTRHIQCLRDCLDAQLDDFEPDVRRAAQYVLQSGGKRLRAVLVFLSGWRDDDEPVSDALVRAAAVIEMVHLATLVHDDVLDAGEMRRNRLTAHRRFGTHAAVLLGDTLFARALHLAACFPDTTVCRAVASASQRVCSGEIIQTLGHNGQRMDRERYRRIAALKTGELFAVACSLGARLANYPVEFITAAEKFGYHLGVAYQMTDDMLDVFGDPADAGKTLGTDFRDGKPTLPVIILYERLESRERDALLLDFNSGNADALDHWRKRMLELGVRDAVESELAAERQQAAQALDSMPDDLPPLPLLRELLPYTIA